MKLLLLVIPFLYTSQAIPENGIEESTEIRITIIIGAKTHPVQYPGTPLPTDIVPDAVSSSTWSNEMRSEYRDAMSGASYVISGASTQVSGVQD